MATEAQTSANRANAQKSTGPRTPEGKETASQNALKHGLFARETVIRGEDQDEFDVHREMLLGQLIPGTPLEEILADRIVDLAWRLKRAVQDQEKAFVALYERQMAGAGSAHATDTPADPAILGRMILEDFSHDAVLERLLRYERRIESSLYRTLNQLRRVFDQRQKAAQEDPSILDRWREEDWNARKARAFACCPPVDGSPEPAGPGEVGRGRPTHEEVPHSSTIPSFQHSMAGPAPEGPPEDETRKTNPISEEVSSEDKSFKSEVSSLKLEEQAASPLSLPTSNFTLQTSGGTPTAQNESCETNPMCTGGNSRQVGYTPVFRRRR